MEINLRDIVWPVCVIQCNEALSRIEPGADLTITVSDPDVVDNIVLLIKNQPDLQFEQRQELKVYQISVHRLTKRKDTVTEPMQKMMDS
jgi:TusA-related sulfurtransferase